MTVSEFQNLNVNILSEEERLFKWRDMIGIIKKYQKDARISDIDDPITFTFGDSDVILEKLTEVDAIRLKELNVNIENNKFKLKL